jgi:SAM-dependent methyltransferase
MEGAGERDSSRQWGVAAEAWVRAAEEPETGASARATEWMLEAAALQQGERVLELACGAARVGLQAAERVAPDGTVLCSDFAEGMVEAVRQRVDRNGIENVGARLLDAESLELEDESFDAVLCRFGYMLMPNPGRALAESCRVLRPGGRLVLAVWGEAGDNPWLTTIFDAVMERLGAPPPEPGTPGPFALGEPGRLRGMVEDAGFAEIDVAEVDSRQTYDSLDDWWQQMLEVGGPLGALMAALPDTEVEAIRAAALEGARHYERDGAAVFPATVVGARAQRPTDS